jgi:hypothetical protein
VASALVLLDDVARGVDLVGKADHSAQAAGVGRRGGADGAEDVAGSVRVRIVVRPLRAAEHGRLVAPEQEVGKPAALLHRVGAMRHLHAGDVVARQLVDAQSQAKGELGGHVEARDGAKSSTSSAAISLSCGTWASRSSPRCDATVRPSAGS